MKSIEELSNPHWLATAVPPLLLCTSAGTQYRQMLDPHVFDEYREAMSQGSVFPPIKAVFDGGRYIVVDGFHRIHAMNLLDRSVIDVLYIEGDLEDAKFLALRSNIGHGLRLSNADKELVVKGALAHPLTMDLPDSQIAKLCGVSRSFVGAVRDPEVRKRQLLNNEKRLISRSEKLNAPSCSGTTTAADTDIEAETPSETYAPDLSAGEFPDEAELLANEAKQEADLEMIAKMLDADDKMAHLFEETKRLNHLVVMKDLRIKELMNEKSVAVGMLKKEQKRNTNLSNKLRAYEKTRSEIRSELQASGLKHTPVYGAPGPTAGA